MGIDTHKAKWIKELYTGTTVAGDLPFVPISSPAFDDFAWALTSDANGIMGAQYRNNSTGESAEMRFVVASNSGYMAVTQPSSANTGTFCGINKSAGSFIFSSDRNLVLFTLAADDDIVFGTDDSERFRINDDEGLTSLARVQQGQGADVASANNLVLGTDGNAFEITGTTEIQLISNIDWQNGAVVTLLFTATPTVKNGTATSSTNIMIKLDGAADFVASAGDTLTLMLAEIGGTQTWKEIGRAVLT